MLPDNLRYAVKQIIYVLWLGKTHQPITETELSQFDIWTKIVFFAFYIKTYIHAVIK